MLGHSPGVLACVPGILNIDILVGGFNPFEKY